MDYVYEPKTTGTGRLLRINGPGLPDGDGGAFYGYTTNSDLVGTLTYKNTSGTAVASATREYDGHRDLLKHVENKAGTGLTLVSKYDYSLGDGYDGAGRRTSVVYTGSAFDSEHHVAFEYNDRGELITADRKTGTSPGGGSLITPGPSAFGYAYDPIGNRITYDVDASTTHYCTNEVNQYDATAAAAGCDPATEEFGYDEDGNLEADGTMTYVWNGENRLVEAYPTTPAAGDVKVRFAYDYMGRRVRKEVLAWNDGAGDWATTATTAPKFVYDGWHIVQVLDGTTTGNPVTQQYTWGLDLSGTLGGAGGIGGLLAVEETAAQGSPAYWYFYDGNGNVTQLLAATNQATAAHYEYDPYGTVIASSGTYADANPFRFSTKWLDGETGLYYFGYRYYAPRFGRWAKRDPIGEDGGNNPYQYVESNPMDGIDPVGLTMVSVSAYGKPRSLGCGGYHMVWRFTPSWPHETGYIIQRVAITCEMQDCRNCKVHSRSYQGGDDGPRLVYYEAWSVNRKRKWVDDFGDFMPQPRTCGLMGQRGEVMWIEAWKMKAMRKDKRMRWNEGRGNRSELSFKCGGVTIPWDVGDLLYTTDRPTWWLGLPSGYRSATSRWNCCCGRASWSDVYQNPCN